MANNHRKKTVPKSELRKENSRLARRCTLNPEIQLALCEVLEKVVYSSLPGMEKQDTVLNTSVQDMNLVKLSLCGDALNVVRWGLSKRVSPASVLDVVPAKRHSCIGRKIEVQLKVQWLI